MIDGRTVRDVGHMLYGRSWRAQFSEAFDVSDRAIRRMTAGTLDIPPGLVLEMERAVREHGMKLDALLETLALAQDIAA